MNKEKYTLLTSSQLTFLLMGFSLGPGFLRLPNSLVKIAREDAWMSAIIALIYPTFIVLASSYIIEKFPKDNILKISKIYFGNILGSIFNFLFLFQFVLYTATISSDLAKVLRVYIVGFLTPVKVYLVILPLAAYAAYNGLKVLGKVTEVISYVLIAVVIFSVAALNYGNILNLQPVFKSGFMNILNATKETAYFYQGFEALLLFHPYVVKDVNIRKASLKAVAIPGIIWTWTVFITIFYLGVDIIPKSHWSFILVFESIHIPIINNFRYVAMFAWILISFRIIANYYFTVAFILEDFTKISIKKLCILLFPLEFYLCLKVIGAILKPEMLAFIYPAVVLYNIIFITLIFLITVIRSKKLLL